MLGFFEGLRDLVAPGRREDSKACGETLLLKLDSEGSTGNETGLPACITRVAGIEEDSD